MSSSHAKALLLSIVFLWLSTSSVLSRPMVLASNSKPSTLMARLKLDEAASPDSPNCWDSLFQLQSCSGEIILFFMNGKTYLGPGCCSAIRVIHKHCWPTMIGSLGFTAEEGDVLEGYCDAVSNTTDHAAPQPPIVNSYKIHK